MASRMHEYNRISWELRGATGAQHRHIEQQWQARRELPDRSGPLTGPESVLGLGAFSASDCPLARLRLDSPPPPEERRVELPIASPETIARYKKEFYKHDFERSGEISTKELRGVLENVTWHTNECPDEEGWQGLGREVSDQSVKVIMQQIDSDGSGTVNFTEFLEGVLGVRERRTDDPPPLSDQDKAYQQMCEAIAKDDVRRMRRLLEKWSVNLNPDPATGLEIVHVAARRGCEAMVSLILEMKGDPTKASRDGRTPLHLAANSAHPERDRSVVVLLAAGASGAVRDEQGYTALHDMVAEHRGPLQEWHEDEAVYERFREHTRSAHYAHGYHSMVSVADIVRGRHRSHRHHHDDDRHRHHHRHRHHEEGEGEHRRHKHKHRDEDEDGHRRHKHRHDDDDAHRKHRHDDEDHRHHKHRHRDDGEDGHRHRKHRHHDEEDGDGHRHSSKHRHDRSPEGGEERRHRSKDDKDRKKDKKKKKDKDRSRSRG